MAFKGLQIDRGKIRSTILNYADNTEVSVHEVNDALHNYTVTIPGLDPCLISFYFPKGSTTIQPVKNRNTDLGEQIAQFVIDKCSYTEPGVKTLNKRGLSDADFNTLLDYVRVSHVQVSAPVAIPYGLKYTLTAKDGGEVTISRYTNNSVMAQGKSIVIRLLLIDIFSELLSCKEAIDMQLESIDINRSSDQVLDELQEAIPDSFAYMGDTLKAISAPSVVLRHVNIAVGDNTFILYPILRGLEGLIKKMFYDLGVQVGANFGGHISYDDRADSSTIDPKHSAVFNANQVQAIEYAYSYYKKNRHGLFHVDGGIDTSRIIETKEEALEILGEIFDIFEYSCKKYHE